MQLLLLCSAAGYNTRLAAALWDTLLCCTLSEHAWSSDAAIGLQVDVDAGALQAQQQAQRGLPASARYFRRKRAPLLSAWVEAAKALGQTLLLPTISLVPCNGVLAYSRK